MKKNQIVICQGSSCFSRGNKENLQTIQSLLASGEIVAEVDFKGQLCTANCMKGPIIIINDEVFSEVSPDKIEGLLKQNLNQ